MALLAPRIGNEVSYVTHIIEDIQMTSSGATHINDDIHFAWQGAVFPEFEG